MSQVNVHWPAPVQLSVPCNGAAAHGAQLTDPKHPVWIVLPAHMVPHTCSVEPHMRPLEELDAAVVAPVVVEVELAAEVVVPLPLVDACDPDDALAVTAGP